jgi:hypothetical protein
MQIYYDFLCGAMPIYDTVKRANAYACVWVPKRGWIKPTDENKIIRDFHGWVKRKGFHVFRHRVQIPITSSSRKKFEIEIRKRVTKLPNYGTLTIAIESINRITIRYGLLWNTQCMSKKDFRAYVQLIKGTLEKWELPTKV